MTAVTLPADRGFGDVKLYATGRAVLLRNARCLLSAVVAVQQKGMKDAWFLASNLGEAAATHLIKLYGRRFTIEENFRDQKTEVGRLTVGRLTYGWGAVCARV